jgi:ABC-type glycerol-3-phosphate transport system substrate-binding protein
MFYRQDLFREYGLSVPATWEEFADTARALKGRAPDKDLTTFSGNDAGNVLLTGVLMPRSSWPCRSTCCWPR